jgi:prepilin-type N-terminal cleavage/methylation domain-containing protein
MRKKAFTLLEMIVVVVLVSIIAAFAIPSYMSGSLKIREREMAGQLMIMHAAAHLYRAQVRQFPARIGGDIDYINQTFGLNITEANGLGYTYDSADPDEFDVDVEFSDSNGNVLFDLQINQNPIAVNNPCCVPGAAACPSRPEC